MERALMEPMLLLQEEAFCCTHPTTRSLAERGVGMSERFMHRWSGGHSTALLQAALVIPHLPNSVHRFRTQVGLVLPLVNFLSKCSAARFASRGDDGMGRFFTAVLSPVRRFLGDDAARRRRRKADRRIRCVVRRRLPQ